MPWYELYGSLTVTPDPEIERIVEDFNAIGGENTADYDSGAGIVSFEGGGIVSQDRVEELDTIAQRLAPHVTDPSFLHFRFEDQSGQLYIGPEEEREIRESHEARDAIQSLLPMLNANDRNIVLGWLNEANNQ